MPPGGEKVGGLDYDDKSLEGMELNMKIILQFMKKKNININSITPRYS